MIRMGLDFAKTDMFLMDAAFAHGCNCSGAMGKGVALRMREMFPAMYKEYKALCARGEFVLGDVFVWRGSRVVFNLATQPRPGPCAQLEAIRSSVSKMLLVAEREGIERIAMPRIGAGLGGLAWSDVLRVLEQSVSSSPVLIAVCEL